MNEQLRRSLLAGCCCIASNLGATVASADNAAVWQERSYSFVFMGFTTTYSCDGLADKLKVLLIASGARSDAKVRPGACANGFGHPDKFARADLIFQVLVPADGVAPGSGAVDGVWHPVALSARTPQELATGDCELVEQFKSNVLPLFSTRSVEDHTSCVPHQESGSLIDLRFESLGMPPPMRKTSPAGP